MWIFDSYYKGAVHLWARERGLVRTAAVQPPSFYLHLPDPAAHRGMIEALESLYRLEEVLLGCGQQGELAVDQLQSHPSEAGIIFDIICREPMCQGQTAQVRLRGWAGGKRPLEKGIYHALLILCKRYQLLIQVNPSKPGRDLHSALPPGYVAFDF